eukprot:146589_1
MGCIASNSTANDSPEDENVKVGSEIAEQKDRKNAPNNMSDETIAEYKTIFDKFDTDGSGSVSYSELSNILTALGINLSEKKLESIMTKLDLNNNGEIDFPEFLLLMENHPKPEDEELKDAFKVFDADDSGEITVDELIQVMKNLGNKMTRDEALDMIKQHDVDGNGQISFEEFRKMMRDE